MPNPYSGTGNVAQAIATTLSAERHANKQSFTQDSQMPARTVLVRLCKRLGPEAALLALAWISALIAVGANIAIPIIIGNAIDSFVQPGGASSLVEHLALLACVVIVGALAQWVQSAAASHVSARAVTKLRNEAFAKFSTVPVSTIDEHAHGDLLARVSSDVDFIGEGLVQGVSQLISGVAAIAGTLIAMFTISPFVCLVVVLLTPLSVIVAGLLASKSEKSFAQQQALAGGLAAQVTEAIANSRLLTLYSQGPRAYERFERMNAELETVGVHAQFVSALANPTTRVVNNITYAVVAAVSCYSAISAWPALISVGQVQSLLSYAHQYMKPFNEISSVTTQVQAAIASAARVFSLLDAPDQEPDAPDAIELEQVAGDVRFEHVAFSYDPEVPVLVDIDAHIEPGRRFALVGATGCGKTTLINLLLRFYERSKGEILVDGHDIRALTRKSLHQSFGMVLQDTWLASGTVFDNIAYGKPDATIEQVREAARRAHAAKFIEQLENGYQTRIGEGGIELSEGQRQLICIARVMLCDPAVLLLDEATSSIDTRTELQVQQAFDEMMRGRTSIVIAHRLSTIVDADQILVMDKGRIVERGTHEELLKLGGRYARLHASQFDLGQVMR